MLLLITVLILSSTVQSPQERLKILRQKLKDQKEKIEKLKGEESGILKNIQELDKEISLTRALIKELKRKREITSEEVKNIELLIDELGYRLKKKREILSERIREIYIQGPLHPIAVVLLSYSFSDALKRIKYLSVISDQDRRVLNEVMRLERRLKLKKSLIEKRLEVLEKIYEDVEDQEEELKLTKKGKRQYLEKVETEREKAIKMSEEMNQAMKDLEQLIRTLSSKEIADATEYFKGKKLDLPVDGVIIAYYGRKRHDKYGTVTLNKGIDLRADWGIEVRAVAPGMIVFSDNFLGYGKIILINHGGGYVTLYGHLSTVTRDNGDRVEAGDVIGKVGQTGSAMEPLLHFEVRKNGKSINPLNFIKI